MMKKKLIAALLAATVDAGTMPSAGALLDGLLPLVRTATSLPMYRRMRGTTIRSKPRMGWG